MKIKPRQCISALNAHIRSGFPLIGDAEISVYAKDIIETIQQLVLKLNEANKAYEASEVDSGFEALTAYHHGYQEGLESTQPEWISVEDELPKKWCENDAEKTLINYQIYSPKYGVDIGNYLKPAGMWVIMGLPVDDVTHWMPLPAGPKEE